MNSKTICSTIWLIALSLWMQAQSSPTNHHYCQKKKFIPKSGGSVILDPGNLRSDTLDVLGYDITLDFTQMNSSQLSATCEVNFRSLMDGIDAINLDLISMTVDSVTSSFGSLTFSHNAGQLHVALPQVLNSDDQQSIEVHYHGTPGQDASWGGFYFQAGYAYNMGVAFTYEPHNFGRAWFPCFDNFVERSSYTFHVLTNQNRTAYCNGVRTGIETVGQDSLLTHWNLQEEIPSYLASVSVCNYVEAVQSFPSVNGNDIPIVLVAKAIDTTDMKNSMVNLDEWMIAAEEHYGPYRWPRVGYCAVPFNGGAMEHSTNISYPLFAIDGTLLWETLYAHEVSHQWWGDLITCRNASDMWINEGWASFSEALFMESIYGTEAYLDFTRANHKDVLLHAHQSDGARYPVSPVPSEITYGEHVYHKGADMAHTLRGYMGDEAFFNAIQAFMDAYAYDDVNSAEMRDFFQDYTSADLTSFFDNWIFAPGFPEFRIVQAVPGASNDVSLTIEQHKHYASDYYTNVPMQLYARSVDGEEYSTQIVLTGETTVADITLPDGFTADAYFLNVDEKISQAVLGQSQVITTTGSHDFTYAEMDFDVMDMNGLDSVYVRAENHFAEVNEVQSQPEFFISPDRWWSVYLSENDNAPICNASFKYYGNESQNNYFDSLFFDQVENLGWNEDSIILVYRTSPDQLWQEWQGYDVVTTPGLTNWTGRIDADHIQTGEYAFALRTGVNPVAETTSNPTVHIFRSEDEIVINAQHQSGEVWIADNSGRVVEKRRVMDSDRIHCAHWAAGIYTIQWTDEQSGNRYVVKIAR